MAGLYEVLTWLVYALGALVMLAVVVAAILAGLALRFAAKGFRALGEITRRDASGFFRHCGYHAPAELL